MHRLHASQGRPTVGQLRLHASIVLSLVNCVFLSSVIALFRVGMRRSRGSAHQYAKEHDNEVPESSADRNCKFFASRKLCGADRLLSTVLGFRPFLVEKASKEPESASEAMQGQLMSTRRPCFIRIILYVKSRRALQRSVVVFRSAELFTRSQLHLLPLRTQEAIPATLIDPN
jgi:hypothetical protein